jgi:hypothetical protein
MLAKPLPGHRVQHDRAFDYIIMGLYQETKPCLAPTVTIKDFAKHVMVVFSLLFFGNFGDKCVVMTSRHALTAVKTAPNAPHTLPIMWD